MYQICVRVGCRPSSLSDSLPEVVMRGERMKRTVTWNKRVYFSQFKHIWDNAIYDKGPVSLRHF